MSSFKKVYSEQFNSKNINYANALNFIAKIYKKLEYIDYYKDYDTKLMMFLEEDFTKNEILFLKNGINELNKAKIFLDNYNPKSKQYFYDEIYNKYVKRTEELTLDKKRLTDDDFLNYVNTNSEKQEKSEIELVNISKELLKTELLIFKTKIERLGYVVQFKNEEIEIFDTNIVKNQSNSLNDIKRQVNLSGVYSQIRNGLSVKGQKLFDFIIIDNKSIIDIIDFIDENTNSSTRELLINEITNAYDIIQNCFMFVINTEDIEKAINTFKNSLEYIYLTEEETSQTPSLIKTVGNYKTVFNVYNYSLVEKENTIKLVYLNNIMVMYYNGVFANEIEGFENISYLRNICNILKNVKGENSLNGSNNGNHKNTETVLDFEKVKEVYIDKIRKAEELAVSTFEFSLKQDFFAIEQQQINEETRIELTKNYLAETVLKYQNIKNIYKATNDQFYFMTTVAESKLSEDDRIDFIAMILSNFAINPTSELSEIHEENLKNILDQLKNIDSIIYETKIAELKFNYVKNKLQEFESNKKTSPIKEKQQKKAYKLDNDFSEQIRLQVSTATFLFDCEEDKIEIVPKELSHDFLLNKFDIDEDILKFYYSPTRQLILDVDYQKMKDSGYHGDIDRVLKPYPINIFGAYYARKKLHTQTSFIANKENYYINKKKITHFSDLIPYFIEYSNGFKKGFSDFEKDCIKPYLNEYSDKSDFTSKIYEYISKKIVFEHDWLYNGGSFTLTLNKNNSENYEIIEAFKDGLKQGYFYKAWSITLGNSNVYSKYFKEYYSKQETTKENLHIPKIVINDDESGFKKATIEDYLEQFKDVIINNTYDLLVDALFQYFTTGSFPVLDRKINFKRINKKRLGWELKELYKSLKTDNLDIEYFRFAKDNINLYANEIIENERFLKSKFYKAFTTNPPK